MLFSIGLLFFVQNGPSHDKAEIKTNKIKINGRKSHVCAGYVILLRYPWWSSNSNSMQLRNYKLINISTWGPILSKE